MKTTLTKLLIPAMLMLVAPITQPVYADVSVRVLPWFTGSDEVCGVTFTGRCEGPGTIWCDCEQCDDDYAPVVTPYGDAVATQTCGGHFGDVFAWGSSGYGVAESFQPIGPGGPIRVTCFPQWGEFGVDAIEFRVHNVGVFEFLDAWFVGDGDFNSSGGTTVQDLFDFLAAA